MKKIKSFILAIIFCFAYTFQASLIPINAQSRVKVVQCSTRTIYKGWGYDLS